MELYRYLIDDFLIQYCQKLGKKDFIVKTENLSRGKKGKREYLNDSDTNDLLKQLNQFFETRVEIPRIRVGHGQTVETLVNEEALFLAKFLRGEKITWNPRMGGLKREAQCPAGSTIKVHAKKMKEKRKGIEAALKAEATLKIE